MPEDHSAYQVVTTLAKMVVQKQISHSIDNIDIDNIITDLSALLRLRAFSVLRSWRLMGASSRVLGTTTSVLALVKGCSQQCGWYYRLD